MKNYSLLIVVLLLSSCKNQCEVCEVLKDGQMIEKYESCDEKGIKTSREVCKEMAQLQESVCKCSKKGEVEIIEKKEREVLKTIEACQKYIKENFKDSAETLWIADSLNDPIGVNMAIIVDGILKAGYTPTGFDQKKGYRIYKYQRE